jgi:hypothetical protein
MVRLSPIGDRQGQSAGPRRFRLPAITGRFLNVIGLFNGSIPIIAIQMRAVATDGGASLFFTKVLDTHEAAMARPPAPVAS